MKMQKRDFITITVNSETAYEVEEETGKYIVVVRQQNDEAVGSLTIKKQGKILWVLRMWKIPSLQK